MGSAKATQFKWRPVSVGAGGWLMNHVSDRAGMTRVARADTYGAWRWDDSRNRWVQLLSASSMPETAKAANPIGGGADEIAVAPSDGRRVYMAWQGQIYRSDDRGDHFTLTSLPLLAMNSNDEYRTYGPVMAVSSGNPDLVLYGSQEAGLWRSADGGRSWAHLDNVSAGMDQQPGVDGIQSPGVLVWPDPANANTFYAFPYGRTMLKSTDGGVQWSSASNSAVQPTRIHHGSFASDGSLLVAAGPEGLWRLANGVWTSYAGRPGLGNEDWQSLVANQATNAWYASGNGGNFYRSRDQGASWIQLSRTTEPEAGDIGWLSWKDNNWLSISQMSIDPVVPNRVWVAEGSGMWYADLDEGSSALHLKSRSRGVEQLVGNAVLADDGSNAILGGWDFGLRIKSANSGSTIGLDSYPENYGPERRFGSVWSIARSSANPSFVVANLADHRFCCNPGNEVSSGWSEDGGVTWNRFASMPVSTDPSATGPWGFAFGNIAVAAANRDNIVWMPTNNRTPQYTLDRGRSWKPIVLPGAVTLNSGAHPAYWMRRHGLTADSVLDSTFYLLHVGNWAEPALSGVWSTADGGKTWKQAHRGEPMPGLYWNARMKAMPGSAKTLFLTPGQLDGTHSQAFIRSADGGVTWTNVPNVTGVESFGFGAAASRNGPASIWIVGWVRGQYGVWYSADDAKSWNFLGRHPAGSLDRIVDIDADKKAFGRVYLALSGSGWVVGETSSCTASSFTVGDAAECLLPASSGTP